MNKKNTFGLFSILCVIVFFNLSIIVANDTTNITSQFLRIGEVQPRGWLLDQIRTDITQGYGPLLDKLTSRMDVMTYDSRNKTELTKPKKGFEWWDGETTGNWLDGFIRTAYLSGDTKSMHRVDMIVGKILAMQDKDGYLGIYPKTRRFESPIGAQNGELWTMACLYRGLLAYYELTGRKEILTSVERAAKLMIANYGDDRPYWSDVIGRGGPGHNIMFVDVCEWLYRLTSDKTYVKFAKFLYDGYNIPTDVGENDVQLRNLSDINKPFHGHGPHVMEHMRIPLFLAAATGEKKYIDAAKNFFPKAKRHLVAGGSCVSDESVLGRLGSPNIGCEYCTSLEFLHSLQSAYEKNGEIEMADAIEILAYNSAQGARQHDGKAIQYCTMDNQYSAIAATRGGRMKLSPTHEDVAVCCPVTAFKFFPYFVNQLWMKKEDGNGLVAVAYAPNELKTKIKGVGVQIISETNYPFGDSIHMTIKPEKPLICNLYLRIPAWKGKMIVKSPNAKLSEDGKWYVLTKEWKFGDQIEISFKPDLTIETMSNGEVYWKRGPLVYALPIESEIKKIKDYSLEGYGDYEYTPKAGQFWEYGFDEENTKFKVVFNEMNGNPWISPPIRLTGNMVNVNSGKMDSLELFPMGMSLLRRVTFPKMKNLKYLKNQAYLLQSKHNLARMAKVSVSSTSNGYSAESLIDGIASGYPDNQKAEWVSNRETTGAKVKLTWESPITIEHVWLFDRPNQGDNIQSAWVNFSDGTSALIGELPSDGVTPFKLDFPEKNVTWMEIIITNVGQRTKNVGFSEIAVFKEQPTL